MSEVGDILADAEVERLIADRANLIFQRNAVQARIDELRFGVEVVAPSGEAQLFGIVLDGYDVTSLGTVDEAAFAPEVVVSGPLEAWVEMIEVIEAEGEADTAHTLNSLTIFGTPMMVRSPDAMGQDKFFRFMGTLQAIFDAAGSASVPVVG